MAATEVTAKIDAALSAKLEALARRTRRTKEALAAAAIAAYVELDDWQIGEIKTGLAELDRDETLSETEAEARYRQLLQAR